MELRPPKRYRTNRRHISLWRALFFLTAVPMVAFAVFLTGVALDNLEIMRARLGDLLASAQEQMATMAAPTPTIPPAQDPMLCLSRANAAFEAGNLKTAIDYYRCAADGFPNDVDVHYQLALLLITSGREQEGLDAARRAILADPTAPDGYAITGMALDWLAFAAKQPELYGEAQAYILRALDIDANFADAYAFLAEVYTDLGRIDDAYAAAEKALELDPANYKAHRNYGNALQIQGRYDEAAAHFEEAIRLNPKLPYIRIQLAQMYLALEQVDAAMNLLLQAVQITGGDPQSYYWLGHGNLVYQGDYEAARSNWETCVEVDASYRPCWERLGNVLLYLQEYDRAAIAYQRAIELGTQKAEIFYYAALVNQLLSRCDNAITYARRGLEVEGRSLEDEANLREVLDACRALPLDTEAGGAESGDAAESTTGG